MNTIEQKIVVKDKLIVEVMVEELLPMPIFSKEFAEDWGITPTQAKVIYDIARDNLKSKLKALIK